MLGFIFEEETVRFVTEYLEWGVTYWTLVNIALGLTGIACSLFRRGNHFGLFIYTLALQYMLVFIGDISKVGCPKITPFVKYLAPHFLVQNY